MRSSIVVFRGKKKTQLCSIAIVQGFIFCFLIICFAWSWRMVYQLAALHKVPTRNQQQRRIPSFVTVVMPSVVNPKERSSRLAAISETWGPRAHSIFVLHDTNQYQTRSNQEYPKPLLLPSNITESMGLERLFFVLNHMVTTMPNTIEYAFFVNDHTFVLPEHLCRFIASWSPQRQWNSTNNLLMYAGHAMKESREDFMFNSGAAGYVLSRETMTLVLDAMRQHDCANPISPSKIQWYQGNPGLILAKCLYEALHLDAVDTRDSNGRHLFHAFGLERMVTGHVDEWYKNKHRRLPFSNIVDVDTKVKVLLPSGIDCCGTYTVSFHYVESTEARILYKLTRWISAQKKKGFSKIDVDTEQMVRQLWPSTQKSLGFYAFPLPAENSEEWKQFLHVLWDISTIPSAPFADCWSDQIL